MWWGKVNSPLVKKSNTPMVVWSKLLTVNIGDLTDCLTFGIGEKSRRTANLVRPKVGMGGNMQTFVPGQPVILRSNNDEPYAVGKFVCYDDLGGKSKPIPVVNVDGEECVCFCLVFPYSEGMTSVLDKLTPKEQWNMFSENYKRV